MTSILRGTLAALAFTSTVWLAATPAAADDADTCEKASGDEAIAATCQVTSLEKNLPTQPARVGFTPSHSSFT
jgi:hypothetical protein